MAVDLGKMIPPVTFVLAGCYRAITGSNLAVRPFIFQNTARCSEIGSLTSLDAPDLHVSCDVREPISLHQAVVTIANL